MKLQRHYVFTRRENLPRGEGETPEGEGVVDGAGEDEEGVKGTPC